MVKRKLVRPPPLQGVVYGHDVAVFDQAQAMKLIEAVGAPAARRAMWLAAALNKATETYYTDFALLQMGTPSEQTEWAARLKDAAETCLQMLVPSEASSEYPREADHRVHSALFHTGEPDGFEAAPGSPAARWGYGGARDRLNEMPGMLWDLRRIADLAEQGWRAEQVPREQRRRADRPILSWIAHAAYIYERAFDARVPFSPKTSSRFVRFADAARRIALTASATESGTDDAARKRLGELTPSKLCSYVREHRAELRRRLEEVRAQRGGNQLARKS